MNDQFANSAPPPVPATANAPLPRHRTRLGEFQTQLLERMRLARSEVAPAVRQLGVMTGHTRWLLDLQQASEITSPGVLVSVPMTQDWFLGLMNIRGSLISVIDFARFQGMPPTLIGKTSRIVTLAPGLAAHSGLLVSRVFGLRSSAGMRAQADDAEPTEARDARQAKEAAAWVGKSFLDQASQKWTELDLSLVTQDPRFMNVGR